VKNAECSARKAFPVLSPADGNKPLQPAAKLSLSLLGRVQLAGPEGPVDLPNKNINEVEQLLGLDGGLFSVAARGAIGGQTSEANKSMLVGPDPK
jgi:hypothetical protein